MELTRSKSDVRPKGPPLSHSSETSIHILAVPDISADVAFTAAFCRMPGIVDCRYRKGQSFGPHIDQPVLEGKSSESEFTVLIYLEGGDQLKGGDTIFHSRPPVSVKAVPGRVCLHWTGHDCLHEGELVTKGTKMVLRTDLFYPRR